MRLLVRQAENSHLVGSVKMESSMPDEGATPIIIFIVSFYAFAIVLLYVLARAWAQALSTRPDQCQRPSDFSAAAWRAERRRVGEATEAMSLKTRCREKS